MTAAIASSPVSIRTARPAEDVHAVPATDPRSRGMPYLTPVPDCEPPFDDEPHAALTRQPAVGRATTVPAVAASPAEPPLAGTPPAGRPTAPVGNDGAGTIGTAGRSDGTARPERATALRRGAGRRSATGGRSGIDGSPTTIAAAGVPSWSSESDIGVRRTATVELPPAQRAASVFARALVEVLSGRRPLAQLRVHCAPEIYAGLVDRPPAGSLSLPHLLTVRVCEPADGVAEVSAAFRRADRVRALAFRIQGVDGRWRITALQVG